MDFANGPENLTQRRNNVAADGRARLAMAPA